MHFAQPPPPAVRADQLDIEPVARLIATAIRPGLTVLLLLPLLVLLACELARKPLAPDASL